jgi:hypothetical protein
MVLSYQSLYNAPVDKLAAAVQDWTDLIGKLKTMGPELKETVVGPLTGWTGKAAQNAQSFIAECAKEVDDAVKEASGIRDILKEANQRIKHDKDELHRIVGQEIPAKYMKIDAKGTVSWNLPIAEEKGLLDDITRAEFEEQHGHHLKEMQKRIERLRVDASEAEQTAAWALHVNLGGQQHNFNAPAHTTLAGAWTAGSEGNFADARNYMFGEMMKNIDSPTVERIRKLLATGRLDARAAALALWAEKVAPNREWDHKPILQKRYGLDTANELYFKAPGQNRAVSYDIWSNIHYGYVGRAAGLSHFELEKGAQVPILAGATDEGDKITVRVGMDIYDRYGPNLTKEQFQQKVDEALDELGKKGGRQLKTW